VNNQPLGRGTPARFEDRAFLDRLRLGSSPERILPATSREASTHRGGLGEAMGEGGGRALSEGQNPCHGIGRAAALTELSRPSELLNAVGLGAGETAVIDDRTSLDDRSAREEEQPDALRSRVAAQPRTRSGRGGSHVHVPGTNAHARIRRGRRAHYTDPTISRGNRRISDSCLRVLPAGSQASAGKIDGGTVPTSAPAHVKRLGWAARRPQGNRKRGCQAGTVSSSLRFPVIGEGHEVGRWSGWCRPR
jgi:hypothetical protein